MITIQPQQSLSLEIATIKNLSDVLLNEIQRTSNSNFDRIYAVAMAMDRSLKELILSINIEDGDFSCEVDNIKNLALIQLDEIGRCKDNASNLHLIATLNKAISARLVSLAKSFLS
jgi:hypothetical protein